MILFIDTESSGLLRDGLPIDDDAQPHLLALSIKLVDDKGRRVHRWTTLVRPDGWSIEAEAEKVHGISERRAYRDGIPLLEAIRPLRVLAPMASIIIGHGLQHFDRRLIDVALYRLKAQGEWWASRGKDMVDTTEITKNICQLPGQFGDYKFPTLAEAHDILIPAMAPYVSTHDAEADVDACERIYFAALARLAAPGL